MSIESIDDDVVKWAKTNVAAVDDAASTWKCIDNIIGGATIVGLGESAHGVHEFPKLRNALFAHLVEQSSFAAIALESGVLEGLIVESYVQDVDNVTKITINEVLEKVSE
jgi:erythromycin esterase-like protein